jgi:hypothetical protein
VVIEVGAEVGSEVVAEEEGCDGSAVGSVISRSRMKSRKHVYLKWMARLINLLLSLEAS